MATTGNPARVGRIRVEQGAKRVRAYLGGEVVADTIHPRLVWEVPYYPAYYFPVVDVRSDLLVGTSTVTHSPSRGNAQHFTIKAGARAPRTRRCGSPTPRSRSFGTSFGWTGTRWTAGSRRTRRSTRTRAIPTPASTSSWPLSRRVRVELDGVVLAESTNSRVLFETGLPSRWYIPKTDVRMDLLVPTETATHCPYKGQAQYWSVRVGDRLVEDVAWSYRTPLPESQKIAGLVAFYNERADLFIDDELQERPVTKFSK